MSQDLGSIPDPDFLHQYSRPPRVSRKVFMILDLRGSISLKYSIYWAYR